MSEEHTPRTDSCECTDGSNPEWDELAECSRALERETIAYRKAAKATLLFYSIGPWDEQKKTEWLNLTQTNEATTKNLCDCVRAALAKADAP